MLQSGVGPGQPGSEDGHHSAPDGHDGARNDDGTDWGAGGTGELDGKHGGDGDGGDVDVEAQHDVGTSTLGSRGADRIGKKELWILKRMYDTRQVGPFVWEFEAGMRRGMRDWEMAVDLKAYPAGYPEKPSDK